MPSPLFLTAWRATICVGAASPMTVLCSHYFSPSTTCIPSCWIFSTSLMRSDVSVGSAHVYLSIYIISCVQAQTNSILFFITSVLRRPTRQASSGAWCSGCSQCSSRWTQRETASCSRGSGETEANSACTKTGDHEAKEAGNEGGSSLYKSGIQKHLTHRCLCFNCRSIWKCKDSWPSSASRSRRRRGRCVWSSRSTQSRWEPKCLLSLFPMPK